MVREPNGPKRWKGHLGPLPKPSKVAPHHNLCGEPPKSPGASATMRSKVRVTLFSKDELRKCFLIEAPAR
jgi:hypothetical protein